MEDGARTTRWREDANPVQQDGGLEKDKDKAVYDVGDIDALASVNSASTNLTMMYPL